MKCKVCKCQMQECFNYLNSSGAVQRIATGKYVCTNSKCSEYKTPTEKGQDND